MNRPRTLEEIKNDIRARLGHRAPFLHADKAEAEEALHLVPIHRIEDVRPAPVLVATGGGLW